MNLEEALEASVTEDVVAINDNTIVVNNDLRTMSIPEKVSILGVESDESVNRLKFRLPRYYCDIDLGEFNIYVNYLNGRTEDIYVVTDKKITSEYVEFSWLVGRNASKNKGYTKFVLCLKKSGSDGTVIKEFNTTVHKLEVLEGLETEVDTSSITQNTDLNDLIDQIKIMIDLEGEKVISNLPKDYQKLTNEVKTLKDETNRLKESLGNVNEEISGLKGVGSGLTTEQKKYIVSLFKSAVYSENMSDIVTALENSFNTIPATGIKLSHTTIKFSGIGDTQKITATLTPDTATSSILWESDNTDVATVKDGVVTAVNDGIATITATSGSATAKCSVNVNTKELYSVSNKVCNADFYEATGLKLGSDSANGYAKSWTLLANFSTTAGAIVYGLNTSAKGCDFGTNGANNPQLMWCSNTCTAKRSANNNWCYALTHEANSNTITIYEYINDEFKKTVGAAAYSLPNASTYAGEICVGGKTSAAYVGTIYDLSIVMRKLTDDEILQFLKSGVY